MFLLHVLLLFVGGVVGGDRGVVLVVRFVRLLLLVGDFVVLGVRAVLLLWCCCW